MQNLKTLRMAIHQFFFLLFFLLVKLKQQAHWARTAGNFCTGVSHGLDANGLELVSPHLDFPIVAERLQDRANVLNVQGHLADSWLGDICMNIFYRGVPIVVKREDVIFVFVEALEKESFVCWFFKKWKTSQVSFKVPSAGWSGRLAFVTSRWIQNQTPVPNTKRLQWSSETAQCQKACKASCFCSGKEKNQKESSIRKAGASERHGFKKGRREQYLDWLDRLYNLFCFQVFQDLCEHSGLEIWSDSQILCPNAIIVSLLNQLVYQAVLRPQSLQSEHPTEGFQSNAHNSSRIRIKITKKQNWLENFLLANFLVRHWGSNFQEREQSLCSKEEEVLAKEEKKAERSKKEAPSLPVHWWPLPAPPVYTVAAPSPGDLQQLPEKASAILWIIMVLFSLFSLKRSTPVGTSGTTR